MSMTAFPAGGKISATYLNQLQDGIGDGYPLIGHTYGFFKVGSTYYRKDGLTGSVISNASATTLIQGAIDIIKSDSQNVGNGQLFFSGAEYVVSNITLKGRGISIIGEGDGLKSVTVFKLANGENTDVFTVSDADANLARDMRFLNFCIDGNKANNPTGGAGIATYSDPCQEEGYIERVMVFETKGAAFHIKAPYWTLFNTTADNCDGGGYLIDGDANDVYIVDGDAYDTQGDGFMIQGLANHARLTDCRAYLNDGDGFQVSAERANLMGCKGNSNIAHGFSLTGGHHHKLNGCMSVGNTGDGFSIVGECYGTMFDSPYAWSNGDNGITLDSNNTANLYHININGGQIHSNNKHGLMLAGCRDSIFTGIELVDCGKGTNDTYDSLRLATSTAQHSTYNVFRDLKIRDYAGNKAKYGINEVDANQNFNNYAGLQIDGQVDSDTMIFKGVNNIYEAHARSLSLDLSGAAAITSCLYATNALHLCRATIQYTEAVSNDAGISLKIGKESDDDYYYTGTSANGGAGRAIWYHEIVTLLKNDVTASDTVIFKSAGGKTGTGEAMLILDYLQKGI